MILKRLKILSSHFNNSRYYLFEFLLIFIAVAAGAWVENVREDFQLKDKERRLMKTLIEDLQTDTTEISIQIKLLRSRLAGMDSIVDQIYAMNQNGVSIPKLQKLQYSYALPVALVGNSDRAKSQIESLGYDIISSDRVMTSVLNYWALKKDVLFNNNRYQDYWWESRKLAYQLFDSRYVHRVNGVLNISPEAKLLTHTESQLIQYSNWVSNMRGLLEIIYIPNLERQSKIAAELIAEIKYEYEFN